MSKRNRRLSRARRRALAKAAATAEKENTDMYTPPPHMATFLVKDRDSDLPATMTDDYWLHLQISKSKEFVKHPLTKADTIVYKGEMFNEIMREADSDWPYVGAEFDVRSGYATTERRHGGRCNVTPACWKKPSVWFWALSELAEQLGMEVRLLSTDLIHS